MKLYLGLALLTAAFARKAPKKFESAKEMTLDAPALEASSGDQLFCVAPPDEAALKLVFASILRAGTGILDGMLEVVPSARVGHIGLYRDPKTLVVVEYYFKMPSDLPDRDVIVVDPMLATGHSAVAALDRLAEHRPKSLKFVCLVSCPEGLAALARAHPDVPVYTAAIDRQLDEHGYILPGLGDAGDRIFGTK